MTLGGYPPIIHEEFFAFVVAHLFHAVDGLLAVEQVCFNRGVAFENSSVLIMVLGY